MASTAESTVEEALVRERAGWVGYVPRTEFGREIRRLREQMIINGEPMLESSEELEREITERRGEDDDALAETGSA